MSPERTRSFGADPSATWLRLARYQRRAIGSLLIQFVVTALSLVARSQTTTAVVAVPMFVSWVYYSCRLRWLKCPACGRPFSGGILSTGLIAPKACFWCGTQRPTAERAERADQTS